MQKGLFAYPVYAYIYTYHFKYDQKCIFYVYAVHSGLRYSGPILLQLNSVKKTLFFICESFRDRFKQFCAQKILVLGIQRVAESSSFSW